MIIMCNYWIFYDGLNCKGILPEPTIREYNLNENYKKIIPPPIRCVFCKIIKHK
jgi:hypothetical protein